MPHLVHEPVWSVLGISCIKDILCSSFSPKQHVILLLSSHSLLQPT